MKLCGFTATAILVLVTLVSAWPQVSDSTSQQINTQNHMDFTRQLADHSAKLEILREQHEAMKDMPERMARMEETLTLLSRMIYSMLVGIFVLIGKEIWIGLKSVRTRANSGSH